MMYAVYGHASIKALAFKYRKLQAIDAVVMAPATGVIDVNVCVQHQVIILPHFHMNAL